MIYVEQWQTCWSTTEPSSSRSPLPIHWLTALAGHPLPTTNNHHNTHYFPIQLFFLEYLNLKVLQSFKLLPTTSSMTLSHREERNHHSHFPFQHQQHGRWKSHIPAQQIQNGQGLASCHFCNLNHCATSHCTAPCSTPAALCALQDLPTPSSHSSPNMVSATYTKMLATLCYRTFPVWVWDCSFQFLLR